MTDNQRLSQRLSTRLKQSAFRTFRSTRPGNRWRLDDEQFAMYWFNAEPNFGDRISPQILAAHVGRRPKWVHADYPAKVLGAGSILHSARPGDLIIGTGAVDDTPVSVPRRARVLAVRGPLTAQLVGAGPDVRLGDPGALIPTVLGVRRVESRTGTIGVIPHAHHAAETTAALATAIDQGRLVSIDLTHPPATIMAQIATCDAVVSSALHGIIATEALAIPTIRFNIGKPLRGGDFKFNDYYLGTGRKPPAPVSLQRALHDAAAGSVEPFQPDPEPIRSALEQAAALLQ